MEKKESFLRGFGSYIRFVFQQDKCVFGYGCIYIVSYLLMGYLPVYLPKLVVQGVEKNWTAVKLVSYTGAFIACMFVGVWLRDGCQCQIESRNFALVQKMREQFVEKLLWVDYRHLQDQDFLDKQAVVRENLFGGSVGQAEMSTTLWKFLLPFFRLFGTLCMMVFYLGLLWKLSPILPLFVMPVPMALCINSKLIYRYQHKWAEAGSSFWQKMDYITRRTEDFSMAKDIRLYQMSDWMNGLFSKCREIRFGFKKKELTMSFVGNMLLDGAAIIFYMALYWAIVQGFLQGRLVASDVLFYAWIGTGLTDLFGWVFTQDYSMLVSRSIAYARFCNFLQFGENAAKVDQVLQKKAPCIELCHVSFHYPGTDRLILEDISLTIRPGEKLAVVGVNGAGKTTLMKLICGLLHPTNGKILLNGTDMETMAAEERYAWFSCAFQDVQFLPLTVQENITMHHKEDQRMWEALEKAGIKEDILALPLREKSMMEKSLNETAVDFSGGQKQKLVLARALYRDTGCLILDEPTAALDALAENDIYQKYASFADGKTSFFVSHRLSSTRFCDRILLLDGDFFIAAGVVLHLLSRSSLAFHGILWKQIVFSVLFLGLLAALLALSFFKNKAQQEKIYQYNEETLPDNRNYNFYINEYICKGECGKTIRMFGQQNILYQAILKMFQRTNENTQKRYQAERTQGQWVGSIQMLISGFVYLMLGLMALNKAISIGSICLYAGCVTNFVHHFNLWIQNLSRLISNTKYVKKYFDFMDTPNIKYEGTLPVEKRDDDRFIMEFRHVTFRYPGSDVDVLKDFSIKFRIGEKLAVVGRNGSGKTTFIKLLCRLYDPTEGEILLNGIDIRKYDYREYLSLFSVVFQDFQIPAFSVGQTVAAAENYDKERVRDAISRAGLSEFLEKLPYGLDTYITKDYDKNGVDISGGEAQKLAIARALYHDTPFVVLDEPTAALDPLAEYEVYAGFDELIGTKTAVYISHRLSSCQFCDDILVIDQGRAVQRGNHQKLIQEEGLYASLWNAQAQYYQTGQQ